MLSFDLWREAVGEQWRWESEIYWTSTGRTEDAAGMTSDGPEEVVEFVTSYTGAEEEDFRQWLKDAETGDVYEIGISEVKIDDISPDHIEVSFRFEIDEPGDASFEVTRAKVDPEKLKQFVIKMIKRELASASTEAELVALIQRIGGASAVRDAMKE